MSRPVVGPAGRGATLARSVVAVVALCVALSSCGSEAAPARQYSYVIPEGTAELVRTNRAPGIFPSNLEVRVGDSIAIVNDDSTDQQIGPYFVRAKTSMKQHFSSPGVLEGSCTLSGAGTLTITVLPRT